MPSEPVHVLSGGRQLATSRSPGHPDDASLWISPADLERASGWTLKPEGLCRDEVCVPLPRADREQHIDANSVCASGLWQSLGRPVLHDDARTVWMLGEAAVDRRRELESLEAPDFTLPDIEGKLHSLSDCRGKKVFLATWASW